ncbi:ABC transporter substrate-binding protein [Halosimplex salinum]|uniref:ABC transporter substrate-binding protein n=1 Tax=Halosimplex salinum TaxID=1710538 RepID=UPI0013DD89C3|nr:ABC transporter substrate-binding protein [Halosimplex salinum]
MSPEEKESGGYGAVVSRRQFVSLAGTTGAVTLAGCSGGGGADDEDGDGGGGGGQQDVWFRGTQTDFQASEYQWNPLVGWFIPHDQFGMWAPWTQYQIGADEFVPHLVQEWEHGDGEVTLTLSEEFTWGESGDPVTAEDLVFQLEVDRAANVAVWEFIDDVEATGDYELTISYPSETSEDIVNYALFDNNLADRPPANWEGTNWEEDPAGVEVAEPDSSGPVHLTDHTDQYSQTEVRSGLDGVADHALAEQYNWTGYRVEYRDGNQAAHTSYIENEADGQHSLFVPPNVLDQFPDSVREFSIPGGFGMGLWFDQDHDIWGQRAARQALMWSINREAVIANVSDSSKIHHPAQTGLTAGSVENWFDSMNPDAFTAYTRDDDRADELLSQIGESKDSIGTVPITFPAGWSDWATACQAIVDQLTDAGWDAEADSRESGPGGYANSDDWVVCADQHTLGGAPRMAHPYFSLDYILRNRFRDTESHFTGYLSEDPTVEVDGEEVDVMASLNELVRTGDSDQQAEIVRRLARVVNEDVPVGVIMEKYEQSFVNTDRFEIPEESDHFQTFWPMWWLPKVDETLDGYDTPGLMKATGE